MLDKRHRIQPLVFRNSRAKLRRLKSKQLFQLL